MSQDHKIVSGQINGDDETRFEEYREANDLSTSQALRRLLDRGMQYREGWSMVRDIGQAAVLWSVASTLSSLLLGTPPRALSMFSLIFAASILTAYAIHRVRWLRRDHD